MGGGDNEITIRAVLDAVGFEKGTQRLRKAVSSVANTVKSVANSAMKYMGLAEKSLGGATNTIKRFVPMLLGVGSAFGIISKAVSAFMSQNQLLSAKMNSIWTALGNLLGPIITQVVTWITTAVSALLEFLRLVGITNKSASQLSKAKNAAGDLARTIAGFDELNVLQKPSGSPSAGLDDFEPSEWMKQLSELIKSKAWDQAAKMIVSRINGVINTFAQKSRDLGRALSDYLYGILHILAAIVDETDWHTLGAGIADFINGIFENELLDGKDIGKLLVGKLTIAFKVVTGFLETFEWGRFAQILSGTIIGAFDSLTNAIQQADFKKIGAGIREFFENIDWEGIKDSLFKLLKEAWEAAIDLLWGLLSGDSEEEPPIIKSLENIRRAAEDVAGAAKDFFEKAWEKFLKPVLEFAVDTALPDFFDALAEALEDIADVLSGKMNFAEFVDNMNGLQLALAGIAAIKFAPGVVTFFQGLATALGGTTAAATTAAGAVGTTTASVSTAAASLPFFLTGLLAYADHLADLSNGNKQAKEAIDATNGSVQDLARVLNNSSDELHAANERYQWDLDNTALGLEDSFMAEHELAVAEQKHKAILQELAEMLGMTTSELEQQIEAAGGDATKIAALTEAHDNLQEAATNVTEAMGTAAEKTKQSSKVVDSTASTYEAATKRMSDNAGGLKQAVEENMNAIDESTTTKIASAADSATGSSDEMEKNAIASFEEMKETAVQSMEEIRKSVSEGWSGVAEDTREGLSVVSEACNTSFASIVHQAGMWGSDLIYNFVNGIYNASPVLWNAMYNIANGVRNYIGFSEPKEGPLSNFHTFAPDMIDLFTEGIDKNAPKTLAAVKELAGGISDAMSDGNYSFGDISGSGIDRVMDNFSNKILDGFSELIARLQSIADNVAFTMPAVAGGGIVPYSVGTNDWGEKSDDNSALIAVIEELRSIVNDFRDSVENMQFVAQFGDLRALAQRITTIQKQIDRSRG